MNNRTPTPFEDRDAQIAMLIKKRIQYWQQQYDKMEPGYANFRHIVLGLEDALKFVEPELGRE